MSESKVLSELAPKVGLKLRGRWLFGRFRGFPVAIRELGAMEGNQIGFQVALGPPSASTWRALDFEKERLKALGLKPAAVRLDRDAWEIVYGHTPLVRNRAEDLRKILDGLVSLAEGAGPAPGDLCLQCGKVAAADVILINGMPRQLCAVDMKALEASYFGVAAADQQVKTDYLNATAMGALGVLVGAGIWAGIGIATGYIFSLAAFGIALIVGLLLGKGAGRVTIPLTAIMAGFTLVAIFFGDLLWVAVLIVSEGGPFDLGLALQAYAELFAQDSSFGLSYFFGILGIVGFGWHMTRAARTSRPRFEVIA